MVKRGVFKKLAALTAVVAMIGAFAASASAVVTVTTTTQYAGDKVNVVANVGGLGGPVEVTYYATKDGDPVYVDQKTAESDGTAKFDYVTDKANINSTAVKVGSKDNDTASGNVPGYTISGTGITEVIVPTENINGTHNLTYTLASGQIIKKVTATGAAVTDFDYADNTLTVVLAGANGDVVLTVDTVDAANYNPAGHVVKAAGIVSDGVMDEGGEDFIIAKGDRKVTVIGNVTDAEEYGVIISANAITTSENVAVLPESGVYEAKGCRGDGYFAVQVIDNGAGAEALFESGAKYFTAIYYKNIKTGNYVVKAGADITVVDLSK